MLKKLLISLHGSALLSSHCHAYNLPPAPPRLAYLGMRFLMPLAPFATTMKEGTRRMADVAVGPASLVQGQAAAAKADPAGGGQVKGAPPGNETGEGAAVACGSGRWGAAEGGTCGGGHISGLAG